ncbi:MAG: hypothetical protein ABFS12_06405 [Bacteroidota bacterium]
MLKKIFTLLLLLFISSNLLLAQVDSIQRTGGFARMQAMGNNPYIIDPYYMTINSAWGAYYSDFIMGDLGSTNTEFGNDGIGQFIGANFKVSQNLTLGAFLSRSDFNGQFSILNLDPYNVVDQINSIPGVGQVIPLNNNVGLMASFGLGKHKLGFGVSYASTTNEYNPADGDGTVASASQIGLNFGFLSQLTSKLLIDASLTLSFPSASYEQPDMAVTSVSHTVISFNARTYLKLSQKFRLVPALQFVNQSGSYEIPTGDGSETGDVTSTSVFILGAGFMYTSGDFLFAGGPAYASLSITNPGIEDISPDLSEGFTGFPIWNFGAEWNFADWIVGRMGYMAITGSSFSESTASATEVNEIIQTVYGPSGFWLGVGFRTGMFSLDATINDDVLRQGLNNIGGLGQTFAYISLSVAF